MSMFLLPADHYGLAGPILSINILADPAVLVMLVIRSCRSPVGQEHGYRRYQHQDCRQDQQHVVAGRGSFLH